MPDSKITNLTLKTPLVAADEFIINDVAGGNLDKKVSGTQIRNYVRTGTDIGAMCEIGSAQSINNVTFTSVVFSSESYDTDTMHDNVTNNTRFTIKTAGKYIIVCNTGWDANAVGERICAFWLNGSQTPYYWDRRVSTDSSNGIFSFILNLAVNDYVELYVYHTKGTALNLTVGRLAIQKIDVGG